MLQSERFDAPHALGLKRNLFCNSRWGDLMTSKKKYFIPSGRDGLQPYFSLNTERGGSIYTPARCRARHSPIFAPGRRSENKFTPPAPSKHLQPPRFLILNRRAVKICSHPERCRNRIYTFATCIQPRPPVPPPLSNSSLNYSGRKAIACKQLMLLLLHG